MEAQEANPRSHAEAKAELETLIARAKRGDAEAIPRLRQYLERNPILWMRSGDLALQAQAAWITLIAGPDRYLKECLVRKVNDLKQQLGGPSPSPLESLMVERIVMAWLRLYYCDTHDAQHEESSVSWAEFRLKRYRTMSDLYAKSIGALALLRKLTLATVLPDVEPPAEKETPAAKALEPETADAAEWTLDAEGRQPLHGRRIHGHNRLAELLGVGAEATSGGAPAHVNGQASY